MQLSSLNLQELMNVKKSLFLLKLQVEAPELFASIPLTL